MPCRARAEAKPKGPSKAYGHFGQERLNNPPLGLVSPDTDRVAGRRTYDYDPTWNTKLDSLYLNLPPKSSPFGTPWPTMIDDVSISRRGCHLIAA